MSRAAMRAATVVNGWVVSDAFVAVVGRFRSEGPLGYRAVGALAPTDAPIRPTRAEAFADIVAHIKATR